MELGLSQPDYRLNAPYPASGIIWKNETAFHVDQPDQSRSFKKALFSRRAVRSVHHLLTHMRSALNASSSQTGKIKLRTHSSEPSVVSRSTHLTTAPSAASFAVRMSVMHVIVARSGFLPKHSRCQKYVDRVSLSYFRRRHPSSRQRYLLGLLRQCSLHLDQYPVCRMLPRLSWLA